MVAVNSMFWKMLAEESGKTEGGRRRGGFSVLTGTSTARLENLLEMVLRDNRNAAKSVIFRLFRRTVEQRLKVRVDAYLEERLWSMIEHRLSEVHDA